jgi:WD40 repeat protein
MLNRKQISIASALWMLMVATGRLPAALSEDISYLRQIAPILQRSCTACHNGETAEGGLNLESVAAVLRGGESGLAVSADGGAAAGSLLDRITGNAEPRMPPEDNAIGAKPLNDAEIDLVRRWIAAGSPDDSQSLGAAPPIAWQPLAGPMQPIYALAVTRDGQYAAVGRGNHIALYQWPQSAETPTAIELIDPAVAQTIGRPTVRAAHLDLLQAIAFSPDGERLASGGYREVKLWRRQLDPDAVLADGTLPVHRLAAASEDGSGRIALLRDDESIEVWSINTWQLSGAIPPRGAARTTAIAWSPDGQQLALADNAGGLVVFATPSTLTEGGTTYTEIARGQAAPGLDRLIWGDGQTLATVDNGGELRLWRLDPSATAGSAIQEIVWAPPLADVHAIAPIELVDGRGLWCGLRDGRADVRRLPNGEPVAETAIQPPLEGLQASRDGKRVVSWHRDGSCRVWSADRNEPLATWQGDPRVERRIEELEHAASRQTAMQNRLVEQRPQFVSAHQAELEAAKRALANRDQAAQQVAAEQKLLMAANETVQQGEAAVAAAQQAVEEAMQRVAVLAQELETRRKAANEATAKVQDAERTLADQQQALATAEESAQRAERAIPAHEARIAMELLRETELQRRLIAARAQAAADSPIAAVRIAEHGTRVAVAHRDGTLRLYETANPQPTAVLRGAPLDCTVLLDQGGRECVAIGGQGSAARFGWQVSWQLERVLGSAHESLFSDRITALDFSPDGAWLAVGSGPPSRYGDLKLIGVADGSVVRDFGELHSDSVLAVRFSPDGRWLATGSADRVARVIDPETGAVVRTLEGHTHHVLGVAWSDDGRTLATGSADQTAKIWDIETGEAARTITGFGSELTSLTFLGPSSRVVTASADRQARVHDAATGQSLHTFPSADGALFAVASDASGQWIFGGGQDGKLRIWRAEPAEELRHLP